MSWPRGAPARPIRTRSTSCSGWSTSRSSPPSSMHGWTARGRNGRRPRRRAAKHCLLQPHIRSPSSAWRLWVTTCRPRRSLASAWPGGPSRSAGSTRRSSRRRLNSSSIRRTAAFWSGLASRRRASPCGPSISSTSAGWASCTGRRAICWSGSTKTTTLASRPRTCHLRAHPAHVPRAPIEFLGLRA